MFWPQSKLGYTILATYYVFVEVATIVKLFSTVQEVFMLDKLSQFGSDFCCDESGQGITEYGAILAFVALLVAVVFSAGQGTLKNAISSAFSAVASQLNGLTS